MAIIDLTVTGQTLDPNVLPYMAVWLDGTTWKPASGGTAPEGVYEGDNIIYTVSSETTVPEKEFEVVFSPIGFGSVEGELAFTSDSETSEDIVFLHGGSVRVGRLNSYSDAPYGRIFYANPSSVTDLKYKLNDSPVAVTYDETTGVILTENSTGVTWYDGATPIGKFFLGNEPSQYWNTDTALPPEIEPLAAKLPQDIAEMLASPLPQYKNTGSIKIHAVLTLYELAGYLNITGLPTPTGSVPLSWRSKTLKMIDKEELRVFSDENRVLLLETTGFNKRAKIFIQDIITELTS